MFDLARLYTIDRVALTFGILMIFAHCLLLGAIAPSRKTPVSFTVLLNAVALDRFSGNLVLVTSVRTCQKSDLVEIDGKYRSPYVKT